MHQIQEESHISAPSIYIWVEVLYQTKLQVSLHNSASALMWLTSFDTWLHLQWVGYFYYVYFFYYYDFKIRHNVLHTILILVILPPTVMIVGMLLVCLQKVCTQG